MNQAQFHLLLNHLPVIGTLVGMLVLAVSIFIQNNTASKVAAYILVVAACTVVPTYLTGEGAEETVESYGINEAPIEAHEDAAKIALGFTITTGVLALLALIMAARKPESLRIYWSITLFSAIITTTSLAWTAHLGGQIRHPEITSGTSVAATPAENAGTIEEDDD